MAPGMGQNMGQSMGPGFAGGMQQGSGSFDTADAPDTGISAWRSLFVANALSERLSVTRTEAQFTWLAMVTLLQGCGWKNAARWYPRADDNDEEHLSAQFNPFLQFALGAVIWMFVIAVQLIFRRISSIWFAHDLTDFVDVCSVANVSVFIMDEPFHGYYIHGKSASSRGDWCHSDLARVLHDEHKGIGLNRGLTQDGCQIFEMFLPPDLAIQIPGGNQAHFRQELNRIFGDVRASELLIQSRKPEPPTAQDVHQMSYHRLAIQTLVDAMVHAVIKGSHEVVQNRGSLEWFWDAPPQGGVASLRRPVFYRDTDGLAWASCLAYGAEVRLAGVGIPTGFEGHLILLEFIVFTIVWRWHGSIYLACALALILNRLLMELYKMIGRWKLSHTTIIDKVFLL